MGATTWRDRLGALADDRVFMGLEILGVTVVVLLHLVPVLDTVLLVLLGTLILWSRRQTWGTRRMSRPARWARTLAWAAVLGVGLQVFDIYVLEPVLGTLLGSPIDLSQFETLRGNVVDSAVMLVLVWVLAAFGEEMAYRGYLLERVAEWLGGTHFAWVVAIGFTSVVFGYFGHRYQGTVGAVEATIVAVSTCLLYLGWGRNLWLPILFHGFYDTTSLVLVFLGRYPLD